MRQLNLKVNWKPANFSPLQLSGPKSSIILAEEYFEKVKKEIQGKFVSHMEAFSVENWGIFVRNKRDFYQFCRASRVEISHFIQNTKRLVFDASKRKQKIQLYFGDILEDTTIDVVVVPMDADLRGNTGFSKQVGEKAGSHYFSRTCQELSSKFGGGRLPAGTVQMISNGRLKAKKIILVVPPTLPSSTEQNWEKQLLETYRNVLLAADSVKGARLVSLPLLGVGSFGGPVSDSAYIGLRVADSLFSTSSLKNIQIIRFCELLPKSTSLIKKAFVSYFRTKEQHSDWSLTKWSLPQPERQEMDSETKFQFYFESQNSPTGWCPFDKETNELLNTGLLFGDGAEVTVTAGYPRTQYTVHLNQAFQENTQTHQRSQIKWREVSQQEEEGRENEEEERVDVNGSEFGKFLVNFRGYGNSLEVGLSEIRRFLADRNFPQQIPFLISTVTEKHIQKVLEGMVRDSIFASVQRTPSGLLIRGDNFYVNEAKNRFLELFHSLSQSDSHNQLPFPPFWSPPRSRCDLIALPHDGREFQLVTKLFCSTLSEANIKKVERIQNYSLWHYVKFVSSRIGDPHTKLLFHGTKRTAPSLIYESHDGFAIQVAEFGRWGRGTYFSVNSYYSDQFAHCISSGTEEEEDKQSEDKQILLCEVIVGEFTTLVDAQPSLVLPPFKPDGSTRYDSVHAFTGENEIFIVYDNGRAYPSYLITYST